MPIRYTVHDLKEHEVRTVKYSLSKKVLLSVGLVVGVCLYCSTMAVRLTLLLGCGLLVISGIGQSDGNVHCKF